MKLNEFSQILVIALVLSFIASGNVMGGDSLHPISLANITEISFVGPSTVDYAGNSWSEVHAAYYQPTIRIEHSLPCDIDMKVKIMEDKKLEKDDHLGDLFMLFKSGSTLGEARTENNSEAQAHGFPAVTAGKFWLAVEGTDRIRGNNGHGDDGHAKVYLEAEGGSCWTSDGVMHQINGGDGRGRPMQSERKTVTSKRVPVVPPNGNCPSRLHRCPSGSRCCGDLVDGCCSGACVKGRQSCP